MEKLIAPAKVILGKGHNVDKSVILGYKPDRKTANDKLVFGVRARIRTNCVIYLGSSFGDNFQTGHNVVIREENIIGDNFNIWNNSTVDYGCRIGNNVKIHCNCYIAQFTEIEDDCFLSPGVIIANDIHPGCRYSKKCMKGPVIRKGAQIGVNSTILPYVVIGKSSLIGAGSVVTKDIPDKSVAYGSPARVVGSIYDLECLKQITKSPYSRIKWIKK